MLFHRTLNVEDYLAILKRRWWIIVIPALIMPVVMFGVTYLVPPEYVSSSLVLVDPQKVPEEFVRSLATGALDTRIAYITENILSRASILPIIEHYNLYSDQHLSNDAKIELIKTKGLHIEAVQSDLARTNGLPGFRITFTASDPHTAQQVCAEITSLFTKQNVAMRGVQAEATNSFVQERLDDAKNTLDEQNKKVAAFEKQYFGELPGDVGSNQNIMGSLSSRLDADTQAINTLEQQKSVGEALLAQQVQSTPISVAQAKAPAAHQAELDQLEAQETALAAQYQPDYPDLKDVRRKITEVKAEIARDDAAPEVTTPSTPAANHVDSPAAVQLRAQLRGFDVQLALKQKDQDDLKRQIQGFAAKIQSSPDVAERYQELNRDTGADQAEYDGYEKEMKQAQATTDLENRQEGETFTLLDEANLPLDPIFPKVPVFVAGGVGLGIVIGLLIIAFLEYKDTALRTEREIWEFTHLPTLAVIAWADFSAQVADASVGHKRRFFRRKKSNDELAGAQG